MNGMSLVSVPLYLIEQYHEPVSTVSARNISISRWAVPLR